MTTVIGTPRLRMVGCSAELLRAEGEGRARLGGLLGACVPDEWPPELYDDDARLWTLARMEEAPEQEGWWMYYLLLRGPGDACELVGVAGYKGPPADDGSVEVGYGILPAFQRRGLATEATSALVERAFAFPAVARVLAETYPRLAPSIGVLEKLGFTLQGPGSEEGVIRYELPRERRQAGAA
jgi:ribosomal-protein-alanine N-acetyltransferase